MLRRHFVEKSISTDDVEYIIGHNGSIYIKMTIKVIVIIFFVYLIFKLFTSKFGLEIPYLKRFFALIGIFLLGKYIIDFMNLYLDGLALSKSGITLVLREGLLQTKTEYFDRERISTINHEQNGIWDKLFARGNLLISLEHGIEFPFENISTPKKQVNKIMKMKKRYSNNDNIDNSFIKNENNDEKVKIFIEAFGEVMKDFMGKDSNKDDEKINLDQ